MFEYASEYARNVDLVMLYIIGISFLLFAGVVIAMIYLVFRYHKKRNPVATNIHGSTLLEIIWTAIPVVLVISMFYFSYMVYDESRSVPKGSYEIGVQAKMWAWKFTYPNGKTSDTLFVPQNKDIKFNITSVDVNHSFYVPAFRIKEDAVQGRQNYFVLKADKIGSYDIACAEYCGLNHSLMYTKMIVVPQDDFTAWVEGNKTSTELIAIADKKLSSKNTVSKNKIGILFAKGCVQCHSVEDNKAVLGPSFAMLQRGIAKVKVGEQFAEVKIDKDYIKRALVQPSQEIVVGYGKVKMPEHTNLLSDDEIDHIVNLLYDNYVSKKQ